MNAAAPAPTARLCLRAWREADRVPFRAINADPRVMACFPSTLDDAQSDALFDRIVAHHAQHGFGLWALELKTASRFIGFTGLAVPQWHPPFGPCVEIGWRLAHDHWGHGYATEAARAALDFGFQVVGLKEIVSFTAAVNQRSEHVMQRLGMRHDVDGDFDHPALPAGHRLARHVLYRMCAPLPSD
ncbi:GNAT family N-acetyltransferase [Cupriavidus sp. 2SB]|uniref:GNAT family N-acetyltransferase n=1 Tax=Cupriavidus sp. 2SB TaxID=2502199 RepID=UPI0010F506CF|nr:GNAT family N-acetyltransferase [Cupriavidus sp. 2SB]